MSTIITGRLSRRPGLSRKENRMKYSNLEFEQKMFVMEVELMLAQANTERLKQELELELKEFERLEKDLRERLKLE